MTMREYWDDDDDGDYDSYQYEADEPSYDDYDYQDNLEYDLGYFERSGYNLTWKDHILQAIYYSPRWHLMEFWDYKLGMKRCTACGKFYFQNCDCIPF